MLLVVSGPSGVGKGAVTAGLMRALAAAQAQGEAAGIRKSVSWTTREARPGEVDRRDYVFVTEEAFRERLRGGGFLEWARVHASWMYGTPREPVEQALAEGVDIILEIDCQGARSVRALLPRDAVLVFIAPPNWEALVARLEKRDTEVPEQLARRLASAKRELRAMDMFQYTIVNDDLDQAVAELHAVVVAERQSTSRAAWRELSEGLLREAESNGRP
jgi:guanylate kinase